MLGSDYKIEDKTFSTKYLNIKLQGGSYIGTFYFFNLNYLL